MKLKHNICIGISFCFLFMLCLYFQSSLRGPVINPASIHDQNKCNFKDEVILELKKVLVELKNYKFNNNSIKTRITKAIWMLENKDNGQNSTQSGPANSLPSTVNKPRFYACPERFLHAKYGDPYFISGTWVTNDCGKAEPIYKTLTVILVMDRCSDAEKNTILAIKKLYPELHILIGMTMGKICKKTDLSKNITISRFPPNTKLAVKLNKLVSDVRTPLVLIGNHMDHFDWLSRIERQLSVFSLEPKAVIVGGSVRNSTGHWQTGCYQSELKFYILKYIEGYYKSRYECMYCDYLLGPFIAQTKLLLENKFDEKLGSEVIFDDFFLRVKTSPSRILMCPDTMYHATDPGIVSKINKRETWFSLIKKWTLNRIVLPVGVTSVTHKFSCPESGTNCKDLYQQVGAKLMPICCRDAFVNGFKAIHQFCIQNDVTYEILGGTTLGAVKLQDIIPWDFDGDAVYYQDKMKLFKRKLDLSTFEGEVYVDNLNKKGKGFFYLSLPDAFIEFWAKPKLSMDVANLSDIYRVKPTLSRIADVWVYSPPNPGLYARNYYGYEMLRHSNGYVQLGRGNWFSPYNTSIPFIKCKKEHHACLDQFQTDGSIQFRIP